MQYSVTKVELKEQPVLVARRRVKQSEIAGAIAEWLPKVIQHAVQSGASIAGHPFARYPEMAAPNMLMEIGFPVATTAVSGADIFADSLPAGHAAMTVHAGPYDQLPKAHEAVHRWIQENGLKQAGAPWESYVTDPGQHPDPKDWKTEIYWPLR